MCLLYAPLGPFPERPSCRSFERWILCTGKRVRGSKAPVTMAPIQVAEANAELISTGKLGAQSLFSLTQAQTTQDPTSVWHYFEDDEDIWPLQLVDRTDSEQMGVLYPLLSGLPHAIQYYLNEVVFPEMLAHQVCSIRCHDCCEGSHIMWGGTVVGRA